LIKTRDSERQNSNRLYEIINKSGVEIKIEYKSIYGETWTFTNQSDIPIKK